MSASRLSIYFTDERVEEIRRQLNSAIHELVFAVQAADQDDPEMAANALLTAQGTIEEVATSINRLMSEKGLQ